MWKVDIRGEVKVKNDKKVVCHFSGYLFVLASLQPIRAHQVFYLEYNLYGNIFIRKEYWSELVFSVGGKKESEGREKRGKDMKNFQLFLLTKEYMAVIVKGRP